MKIWRTSHKNATGNEHTMYVTMALEYMAANESKDRLTT